MNQVIAALFVLGTLFGIYTAVDKADKVDDVMGHVAQIEATMENLPEANDHAAFEYAAAAIDSHVSALSRGSARIPRSMKTGAERMNTQVEAILRDLRSQEFDDVLNSADDFSDAWADALATIQMESPAAHGASVEAGIAAVSALLPDLTNLNYPASLEATVASLTEELRYLDDVAPALPIRLLATSTGLSEPLRVISRSLEAREYTDASENASVPVLINLDRARTRLISSWGEIESNSNITQSQLLLVSLATQARDMTTMLYERAGLSVEISISLIGIMALWLGIMRVAEEAGIIQALANLLRPILKLLFPGIPKDHPANGALLMAMSANILGLDNAGTPLGIKAMQELQTLNLDKPTITNNQVMHLALSTSSLNLIPFSIIGYRIAKDSAMPNDIVVPVIVATSVSSIVAIIMTVILRRFSTDPQATGADADRITEEINAELHAALDGDKDKEDAK